MDFASLMSAQMAKSKKSIVSGSDEQKEHNSNKYIKRSEVESRRQAAYLIEQNNIEKARMEKLERKREAEEEEAEERRKREEKRRRLAEESRRMREKEDAEEERKKRTRLGLPEIVESGDKLKDGTLQDGDMDIPEDELVANLRRLKEPATMFGEGHIARLKRYRKLMETGENSVKWTAGPIPTILELVPEAEMKVPMKPPKDSESKKLVFRQLASYFAMVLREWEIALGQRNIETKTSFQGKAAFNAMVQARENMRPLYRKMERGDLDEAIFEAVVEIVRAAQERRYVDANDGYLRLSIGKAAWPIGVTMVGIHERSAREKLHESDKGGAHIMSDETTRKFLQSIKRCLSFAQTRWPPDDQLQLMG